jgi:hypothetical protein
VSQDREGSSTRSVVMNQVAYSFEHALTTRPRGPFLVFRDCVHCNFLFRRLRGALLEGFFAANPSWHENGVPPTIYRSLH